MRRGVPSQSHKNEGDLMVVKVITGNEAAAHGARLSRVEIVPAYPITPQTTIVEQIAEFIANGEMRAELMRVESEYAAMGACIGASLMGARTFTATSSQGLAFMHELTHWAAGSRLPIVMGIVNRALAPPWNIWSDQQDALSQRDTGWLSLICENNQEILDTCIQAYRIVEHPEVLLPVMFSFDGFALSHTAEPVEIPSQEKVDDFLPEPIRPPLLDVDDPTTLFSVAAPEQYMELRYWMDKAAHVAKQLISKVDREFGKKFGRSHGGLLKGYKLEGANVVLLAAGSICGTVREVVDSMRRRGEKVGMIKLRSFRPFPREELRRACEDLKVMGVLDQSCSFGMGGIIFSDAAAALQPLDLSVLDFIAGLGGRDITTRDVWRMFKRCFRAIEQKPARAVEWFT